MIKSNLIKEVVDRENKIFSVPFLGGVDGTFPVPDFGGVGEGFLSAIGEERMISMGFVNAVNGTTRKKASQNVCVSLFTERNFVYCVSM
jgi:hypothetical protein